MPDEKNVVYVVGHQRPDTDACVSAFVAARLKKRLDPTKDYSALIQGEPNAQTAWLFKQAGEVLPPLRTDIRPTVGERMRSHIMAVREHAHLGDVLKLMKSTTRSMIPVLDVKGRLLGILSDRLPQNQYFYHFNVEDYLGELLDLDDVVRALQLKSVGEESMATASGKGKFRVAIPPLTKLMELLQPGDILITGPDAEVIAGAKKDGVHAIIMVDCKAAQARALASKTKGVCCYHYPGSMMAFLSQLPMAIPVSHVMAREFPTIGPGDFVHEVVELAAQTPYALPVVDERGILLGDFSRSQALDVEKRQVILVDHFEKSQSIAGLDQAEVVEIIDHHRVGNIETLHPIRVDCRPIGSTSSILACQYYERGLLPTKSESLLMLGAIVADTLLLTSPTATDVDREMVAKLSKRCGVNLQKFGREVLTLNDELATGEPASLIEKDLKEFQHGGIRFLAAQLETVDIKLLTPERLKALVDSLREARRRLGCAFAALMVTDVFRSLSHVVVCDESPKRGAWILEGERPEVGRVYSGMVSRKKQLLPMLLERLDSYKEN